MGYYGGIHETYEEDCPHYLPSEPGDLFSMDADITIYWPRVRPIWEKEIGDEMVDETSYHTESCICSDKSSPICFNDPAYLNHIQKCSRSSCKAALKFYNEHQ